jgi:hypothetical protein
MMLHVKRSPASAMPCIGPASLAFVFLLGLATSGVLNGAQQPAAAAPQLGTAVAEITPPVGYRMSGYFYERLSTGVLNPLRAKALVLSQGKEKFAWVFCDLVGVPKELTDQIRDEAAGATGIPREQIFIAATHTHTGPLYFGPLRDYFHEASTQRAGADPQEKSDYAASLRQKLVQAIQQASSSATPVEIHAGTAQQDGLSFNRRYVMRDGSVRTNPGKLNPDIARPAGPIDPQVGLLQFRRGGKPAAGVAVFGLHCDTTGGTEFAADYPFFLHRELQKQFSDDYLSAFAAGTCGDVNHLDLSTDRPQKSFQESERIGATLAATVVKALSELPPVEQPSLAAVSKTVATPLQHYSEQEIHAARGKLPKVGMRELPGLEQVAAVKIVGIGDYGTETRAMDVQAFRLSDTFALVALTGELFAELGLAIKQKSPFSTTLVVELANDYPGYIPTRRAFAEGGYEPTNSKVAPGGGELLVDAAIELLHSLKKK